MTSRENNLSTFQNISYKCENFVFKINFENNYFDKKYNIRKGLPP